MINFNNKKKISLVYFFIFFLVILFFFEKKTSFIKSKLNFETKVFIKKYFLPYRYISEQENIINVLQPQIYEKELNFQKSNKNIQVAKMKDKILSNKKLLQSYKLINGFDSGIWNLTPGSGYIDFDQNNLFILSSRGVLGYSNDISQLNFKQIKNNISEFININHFKKNRTFSIKDLMIHNKKIFISFTEEIKKNCWNTSIIYGNINYEEIKFSKLFNSDNCVNPNKQPQESFRPSEAGGRIVNFDDNNILLTVGEYRHSYLAQNKNSINGKLLKINIQNYNFEIISMGHRNQQGLYFDKETNIILETEHGPQGGDEINIIEVDRIDKANVFNFGWPIVSAGEHYGGNVEKNKLRYQKYPLYKSHTEHGFIEPLKTFVPSIGISEISKISENRYVVSSLKDKSLYFFNLKNKKISNLYRLEIFERIRDLKFKENKLYLYLEDTASIGIINLDL